MQVLGSRYYQRLAAIQTACDLYRVTEVFAYAYWATPHLAISYGPDEGALSFPA